MKRIIAICMLITAVTTLHAQFFTELFRQVPMSASPGSRQGAVAFGGRIFQFFDGAPAIDVYSVEDASHLYRIPLDGHKSWHCNNAALSDSYLVKGDRIPLIYVSQENRAEHCICVFRIVESSSRGSVSYSAEVVQRILLPTPVQMGVWYPNLALDCDGGFLYITGYSRESWKDARFGNGLQILKFALPACGWGEVELTCADILARRVYPFRLATQGAVIRGGRMYQVYGMGGDSALACYDLESGAELWSRDLAAAGIPNEPESLFFLGDSLVCVDARGIVYSSKMIE